MMRKLADLIKGDAITAMKNGEKEKLSTLRLLVAELEKEKVNNKIADVSGLTDEQTQTVISRQIKKLDKEIEAYKAVNRDTTSQEEEKEILITYLPKQLTEEEIKGHIDHAVELVANGAIKNIMQYLGKALKGKADMKQVQEIIKNRK